MTPREIIAQPGWRYKIQHGPDGEANYAWVYDEANRLICTAKTHDAIKIVEAVNLSALQSQRPGLDAETIEAHGGEFGTQPSIADVAAANYRAKAAEARAEAADKRLAEVEAERDEALEYGKQARLRENEAEDARVAASDVASRLLLRAETAEAHRDRLVSALRKARTLVEGTGEWNGPIPRWALEIRDEIDAALSASGPDVVKETARLVPCTCHDDASKRLCLKKKDCVVTEAYTSLEDRQ